MDLTVTKTTEKEYNLDTYKYESQGKIIAVETDSKDKKVEIILDKTIFHPQGGGQPSDEGTITYSNGNVYTVIGVTYDREKDIVRHKLDLTDEKVVFKSGEDVK